MTVQKCIVRFRKILCLIDNCISWRELFLDNSTQTYIHCDSSPLADCYPGNKMMTVRS